MQLDRNKNLYRLATYFLDQGEPTNLCDLVRRLTWNIFLLVAICLISGALLGDLLASLAVLVTHNHFELSAGIGFLGLMLAAFVIFFVTEGIRRLILQDTNCESVELAKEWVSAKKSKICPMIDYK